MWRIFLIALTILFSCKSNDRTGLLEIKTLHDYPSASAIEYHNGKFYLIGDDATHLLVLDKNFRRVDSILLVSSSEKRIPKDIKPDLESIALDETGEGPVLFLAGSGSAYLSRNRAWKIFLQTSKTEGIRLDSIYQNLKNEGNLDVLNIEGICSIPNGFLMANRGHLGWRYNHLLRFDGEFPASDSNANFSKSLLLANQADTNSFSGVSGLDYSYVSGSLIISFSTEETRSSYDDGKIGKSYVGIVEKFVSQVSDTVRMNRLIDLNELDERFANNKIESACIVEETDKHFEIALCADNDDGSSTLFRLRISKQRER